MNFYNFNLLLGFPKKFLLSYKHLIIVNDSVNVLTVTYSNGNIFAVINGNESFTFLDVIQKNYPLKDFNNSLPSMQLTISANVDNSQVRIFNYGV
jgi:hypothetical protein